MLINLGIIDFNTGNLRSLLQVFNILPLNFNITFIKEDIDFYKVDKLIIPGQSSINSCLYFIKKNNLFDFLLNFSKSKPIMGICVGKHIFFSKSEESNLYSLNFFSGFVKKFKSIKFLKIPHIGWGRVRFLKNHFLLNGINNFSHFYFAHSFYTLPDNFDYVYGLTKYGFNFSSIFIKNNILLIQFHPEKSSLSGLKLIYNFSIWDGEL